MEGEEFQSDKMVQERNILTVESRVRDMRLIYTNADGLISKKLELVDLLNERDPDIVYVTKTKLSADDNFMLKGYDVWRKDRADGRGGLRCF